MPHERSLGLRGDLGQPDLSIKTNIEPSNFIIVINFGLRLGFHRLYLLYGQSFG